MPSRSWTGAEFGFDVGFREPSLACSPCFRLAGHIMLDSYDAASCFLPSDFMTLPRSDNVQKAPPSSTKKDSRPAVMVSLRALLENNGMEGTLAVALRASSDAF